MFKEEEFQLMSQEIIPGTGQKINSVWLIFLYSFISLCCLNSCTSKDNSNGSQLNCSSELAPLDYIPSNKGTDTSYRHILAFASISDECINQINYSMLIKNYVDTVKSQSKLGVIDLYSSDQHYTKDVDYIDREGLIQDGLLTLSFQSNDSTISIDKILFIGKKIANSKADSLKRLIGYKWKRRVKYIAPPL